MPAEHPDDDPAVALRRVRPPQDDVVARRMAARIRGAVTGAPAAPIRLGRFEVLEFLGSGGMGTVFAAFDPKLDRKVAIKVLHGRDAAARDRVLAEARALARLSHPNVIAIYDASDDRDTCTSRWSSSREPTFAHGSRATLRRRRSTPRPRTSNALSPATRNRSAPRTPASRSRSRTSARSRSRRCSSPPRRRGAVALSIDEAALGVDHPDRAYDLTCVGEAELGRGQSEKARELLERALALRTKAGVTAATSLARRLPWRARS